MRIVCIGGGPAGLYFAILMKQRDSSHRVSVIERNRADAGTGKLQRFVLRQQAASVQRQSAQAE